MPLAQSLSPTSLRPVLYILGYLLGMLATGMVIPAVLDAALGNPDWAVFAACAAATGFLSTCLVLAFRAEIPRITLRQGFLFTNLAWVACTLFGAIPLMYSSVHLSFVDAVFESISGLSTTGATVIVGLDTLPEGILLWRALLTGFGGLGIVVMALIILPFLRVGGMQLFRTESSDRSDKVYGNARALAEAVGITYLVLCLLSTLAFVLAGMPLFDAICHALAAIATGGFSTKDASIGAFNSDAIIWIATVSMFAGALPLTWYIRLLRDREASWRESQPRVFMVIVLVAVVTMTLWTAATIYADPWEALTRSAMNVVSVITTTGFVCGDFNQWGAFAVVAFFMMMFIGGCTGSTSGSIKIFRWQILANAVHQQMQRMLEPNRVLTRSYDGRRVEEDVVYAVIGYFFAYVATFGVLSVVMGLLGNDIVTSLSGVAAAMGAIGPGLGDTIGPAGTYQPLSDPSKILLSVAMLLGRLELFTCYVLLTVDFWRD